MIARRLTAAMGLKKARIVQEGELSDTELMDADLLFVGRPQSAQWWPDHSGQFLLTKDAIILNGRAHDPRQNSFFGVFPHPVTQGKTTALFMPDNLSVAKSLSTKIPHYGKYSYLVFNESRNQVKGTWAVESSPMVVRWPQNQSIDRRHQ